MSYTLEKAKRVIFIHADDHPAYPGSFQKITVFLDLTACSNVSPKTFTWQVRAVDNDFGSLPHVWGGEVQLPLLLWQCACDADGGGIKTPGERDITGLEYIRQWKKAAGEAVTLDLAQPPQWLPDVDIWLTPVCPPLSRCDPPPEIVQLWQDMQSRLERGGYPEQRELPIASHDDLLAALRLWQWRGELGIAVGLHCREGNAFLEARSA